ncbi:Acetylcholine receptor subunit beta-like 1 [Folsomia candida]|uniref:Acetylcholine receptor subunit beta-like 1 n=1 Tax=Folsomia candida TaxID=158441 RepID=A0A226DMN8_FOLCA|nr:Acetylcholine receptor subunit beta-like 1 [Folsomia candida]
MEKIISISASVEEDYIKKLIGDSTENGYKLDMLPPTGRKGSAHNFTQEPVMVDIALKLSTINELFWNDSRLQWQPDVSTPRHGQGSDVTTVNIAPTHIWTPNIALANSYEAGFNTNMEKAKKTSLSHCTIDVTYYPWDQQICVLKFLSLDYNGNQLQFSLHNKDRSADLIYFDVIEAPAYLNQYTDGPYLEQDATFYVTLRRRSGGLSPALWLVLSLNVLTCLSILTCLLPSKNREMRSLLVTISGMGVLLIFYRVMETLPPTSLVLPMIVKYILFSLGVILTAFVGNLVTANIYEGMNLFGKKSSDKEGNLERRLKIGNILDMIFFFGLGVVWIIGNLWVFKAGFPY